MRDSQRVSARKGVSLITESPRAFVLGVHFGILFIVPDPVTCPKARSFSDNRNPTANKQAAHIGRLDIELTE